jgi:hypothetical protein
MLLWEWTYNSHATFQKTIVTTTLESGTHVQKEVSHLFPHHTQQADILITRNDFGTLLDAIIIDLICLDMV